MEKVKIKIKTTQTIDKAGNEDIIELVTEATREFRDDCIVINYDESNLTEGDSSKTRLKIYKNRMTMTKVGSISTKMDFEKNKNYSNLYSTPYGTFNLEFITDIYLNNLDEKGNGTVYVEYKIIFAGSDETYNKLRIDIN